MIPEALALSSSSFGARSSLCRNCLKRLLASASHQQTRQIAQKVLEKRRVAQESWDAKAKQIQEGSLQNPWDMLKERGYVKDTAGTDDQIRDLMLRKRIGAYVGVDPTAPSLHVGHLVPLMALFWMYMHGYRAITVIGGATGKIGDPTDRLKDREKIPRSDFTVNVTKIHYQLKTIWLNVEEQARRRGYQKEWIWSRAIWNNSQWYNSTSFMTIVTRLFKGVRLGPMLSRDNVKRRMESGDGMPLDEFIYPLIQAWDWWHLFSSPLAVQMQIGGSDQYGNIVSGIDAIKYLRDTEPDDAKKIPDDTLHAPVGFTAPLLTDSSGVKFGKSAGNAVWLDPFMTSSFDLYGYFMRRPDADVEQLLRLLTFMPLSDIKKTLEKHDQDPTKRIAHHALAYEVVALAHGARLAKEAQDQHLARYSKGDTTVSVPNTEREVYPESNADHHKATEFRPDIELPESLIFGKSIGRILHAAGLATSASDGHRLTAHQGAYVAGAPGQPAATNKGLSWGNLTFTPVKTWFPDDTKNFIIDGKLLILRRGKHFIRIVKVVSDDEWKKSGRSYPGEPGSGRVRQLRSALEEMGTSPADLRSLDTRDLVKIDDSIKTHAELDSDDPKHVGKLIFPRGVKTEGKVEVGIEADPAQSYIPKGTRIKAEADVAVRRESLEEGTTGGESRGRELKTSGRREKELIRKRVRGDAKRWRDERS